MPQALVVKNKRLKMSPGGIISLPVSARKSLGMSKGKSASLTLQVQNGAVVIKAGQGVRVSPKGELNATPEVKELLAKATERHFWLEADDAGKQVILHPFR